MGKLVRIERLNSKGLTLVEILAVLILLSIIITLSMSIFITGKNTVDRQSTKANMQDSVTLAMKDITKQVRSVAPEEVSSDDNIIEIGDRTYRLFDNRILKDNVLLVENIDELIVLKEGNLITIRITSTDNEISLFSEILIRE